MKRKIALSLAVTLILSSCSIAFAQDTAITETADADEIISSEAVQPDTTDSADETGKEDTENNDTQAEQEDTEVKDTENDTDIETIASAYKKYPQDNEKSPRIYTTTDGVEGGILEYIESGAGVEIAGFTGSILSVDIPETLNGKPVVSIGADCFVGNREQSAANLTSVTIPSTVTHIGKNAFAGGSSDYSHHIVELKLPKGLKEIENNAFQNCTQLKTLDMSGITLDYMGTGVFSGCTYLTGVTLDNNTSCFHFPGGITELPQNTFSGCTRLQNIDNLDEITLIGDSAFNGCKFLDKIDLPEKLWRIGQSAFVGCTNMVTVTGGESLSSIGASAFSGCTALVNIPDENFKKTLHYGKITFTENGKEKKNVDSLGADIFAGCTSLVTVELPESTATIPEGMFRNCTALETPVFPPNIHTIMDRAFQGCILFDKVILNNTIVDIGPQAFDGCTGVKYINIDSVGLGLINANAFSNCSSLTEVTIKSPFAVALGGGAFCNNSALATVNFNAKIRKAPLKENENVIELGNAIFSNDPVLETFQWPESTTDPTFMVTELPPDTFNGCKALTWDSDKLIGATVIAIGDKAFANCTFTEVNIPDQVQTIGKNAFAANKQLTKIDTGKNTKMLDEYALANCTALTDIALHNSLELINKGTFSGCTALATIALPESITYTGDYVFEKCTSLTDVNLPQSLEAVTGYMFSGCSSLEKIDLSKTRVTSIKVDGFQNCTSLKTVIWPDVITSIDNYAFTGCAALETITLPRSLLTIGQYAFNNCKALTQCNLNEGLTIVNKNAFNNCSALRTVFLPVSARTIGDSAFTGCTSLTTLIIPASVTTIGKTILGKLTQTIDIYAEEGSPVTRYNFGSTPVNFIYSTDIPDTLEGRLFSLELYKSNYPEVAECFDGKPGYLFLHWKNFGIYDDKADMELSDPKAVSTGSYIFNAKEYERYNPEETKECSGNPSKLLEHYLAYGCAADLTASRHFAPSVYKKLHPELTGEALVKTYLDNGMKENADALQIGDVTEDGVLDSKDTVRLLQYIAGAPVTADPVLADVNGDSVINSKDSAKLLQTVAGLSID